MARTDPQLVRRQALPPFTIWHLWAGLARESFLSGAQAGRNRDIRAAFGACWLMLALLGVVISAVSIGQARYQSAIERGVTGLYRVARCGHPSGSRVGPLDSWSCDGTFRPDSGGGPRSARLHTDQSEEPRGLVKVMAAASSDSVVWLPADVSAQRRRMRAVLSFALITVPALAMFWLSGRPLRRKSNGPEAG